MHALLIFLALCQDAPPAEMPVVVDSCDLISVAHCDDGARLIFFWSTVNGDWMLIDHRWYDGEMAVSRSGDHWSLAWPDADCYRIVESRQWVESAEAESPLVAENGRPWFARLLEPGLRQPGGGQ